MPRRAVKFLLNDKTWLVCASLLLLFSNCRNPQQQPNYLQIRGQAQGTTFQITYADAQGRNFSSQADSMFKLIDKSMSLWDSTSLIVRINNNEAGVQPDAHLTEVFKKSMAIAALTGGAFDPTVAPLVRRWGFHFKKNEKPPDSLELREILKCVGWKKVRLRDDGSLEKFWPCVELDFNAIAQGYTVDLLAQFLENQAVENFMVEVGGEVRASGVNPDGKPWQIGIDKPVENPAPDERPLQRIIALKNQAVATSGNYRKFVEIDGKKYSHAIDPTTGLPAQSRLLSASVRSKSCADADALATAFMVMGLDKAAEQARTMQIAALFIYQNDDGDLTEMIFGDW